MTKLFAKLYNLEGIAEDIFASLTATPEVQEKKSCILIAIEKDSNAT